MTTVEDVLAGRAAWAVACTDALDGLRALPDGAVNCVVTSPPYPFLRSYLPDGHPDKGREIGLEPDVDSYVARLVAVFAEVRRTLHPTGVLWLNLGSCYWSDPGNGRGGEGVRRGSPLTGEAPHRSGARRPAGAYKPKDLVLVPYLVAEALRRDGWWLRSDCIFSKPNPLPESVTDRPTTSHEHVFLLTKRPTYWWDAEAVREPNSPLTLERHADRPETRWTDHRSTDTIPPGHPTERHPEHHHTGLGVNGASAIHTTGRNKRTVWTIPTQARPEQHFASFPDALAEVCVLSGCPPRVCPACGAPHRRVVERTALDYGMGAADTSGHKSVAVNGNGARRLRSPTGHTLSKTAHEATGWTPGCAHSALDPIPGVTLDVFCGRGTTVIVANRLGRRAIGFDLNPAYVELAVKNIVEDAPLLNTPAPEAEEEPAQLGLWQEAAG